MFKNLSILFIALTWLTSGLFFKIIPMNQRHENIVARILGHAFASEMTLLIGFLEVILGIWILSKKLNHLNAFIQLITILAMNILEFTLAKDLLLWGPFNIVFAFLFMAFIWYTYFQTRTIKNHDYAPITKKSSL
ncbi:DoxX-like family protein [Mangrovimonas futianensis]|uniref:DoxX-like family protein n=1 Tax=Mangrovimonas futianensis TaxID=2895523 RepID=UPI002105499C|nr:DoxX-like family protein [Mangrovimonas futianensis]